MDEQIENILKNGRELGYPLLLDASVERLIDEIKKEKPKRILEIGTAIGYSGSVMLSYCDGTLVTVEKNTDTFLIALENFEKLGFSNRVRVVNADAKVFLDECNDKFDFIFLDGPKGQYINYKEKLVDMLNIGGVLFADNVLFRGMVEGGVQVPHRYRTIVNNLRKFLCEVKNDDRLKTVVENIGDGISISKKIK